MTESKLTPKKIRKLLHRELRVVQKNLGKHIRSNTGIKALSGECFICREFEARIESYKTAIVLAGGRAYD